MTVCQFFLEGRCRYGRNCKFEHSYNDDKNNRGPVNSQQPSYQQVVDEVILAEKGKQWPLSCFCPVKGGSNIPGLEDFSPEEVRWKMYEARAKGTLNQCKQEINQLFSHAEKVRNLIKDSKMERVIVNVLKGKIEQPQNSSGKFTSLSTSTNIFGSSKPFGGAQNIFGSAISTTGSHGSIFGGTSHPSGSIFGGITQPTGSIFGGSTSFSGQSIFGNSASTNIFSNAQNSNQNLLSNSPSQGNEGIFSNTSIPNKNLFMSAGNSSNKNASNAFLSANGSQIFQNQPPNNSIFGSNSTFFQSGEIKNENQTNIFGSSQNENIFKAQNSFSKPNSVFNASQESTKIDFGTASHQNPFSGSQQMNKEFDSSIYSKVEDLSEEEIKSFSSATFTFGKIPLKPPPVEYCK